MKNLKHNNGFTLIEVLVVVAIIGIVFFVFIPQVNSAFLKSKESGIYTDFRTFQQANESFFRETRGVNLQISSLNKYLDSVHKVTNNGTINQTKSKDPWKNPYEVELKSGKITFSSYGVKEDYSLKPYNVVTYLYNGTISSCTTGLGTRELHLSIPNLDVNFKCGDDITTTSTPPIPSGVPDVPTNFKAFNITATSIDLSWDSMNGTTTYKLDRDSTKIYSGLNTSFSDTGLTPGTTYRYFVTAFGNGGNRNPASIYVTTLNSSPSSVATPTNFVANNITENSVDLSWSSVVGATNYELKRNGLVVYAGNNVYYKDNALLENTSYTYTLVAKNSSSSSTAVSKIIKTSTITANFAVKHFYVNSYEVVMVKSDGSLWTWGGNNLSPTRIGTNVNWKEASNSFLMSAALREDGTLWTWGYNSVGQLGHGDTTFRINPTKVGTETNWKTVKLTTDSVFAIKNNGTLWSWGDNYEGQLGHGDKTNRNVPTQVGTDSDWKDIYPGGSSTFAVKKDGTLWSWGNNYNGHLGHGDYTEKLVPTQVGTDTWKDFVLVYPWVIGIKSDGTLWEWGTEKDDSSGNNGTYNPSIPTQIRTDNNWNELPDSNLPVVASKNDGTIHFTIEPPTELASLIDSTTKELIVALDSILVIKKDGTLWGWGGNSSGQLGLGDTTPRGILTQIGTDTDWKHALSDNGAVYAIKNDGSVWSWGENSFGQLGLGDKINRYIPTKVMPK